MSRRMDMSSTTQVANLMVKHRRPHGSSRTKCVWSPTCWPLVGTTVRGSSVGTWMGNSTELGMSFCSSKNKDYSCRDTWMTSKWLEESRIWLPCGRIFWNLWISENQQHFLPTFIWDVLNVNARRTRVLLNNIKKCSNHESLLQQLKSYQGGRNLTQKSGRMVLRHGRTCSKCVARYCALANKKKNYCTKFQPHAWMITTSKKEELEAVGNLSNVCSQIVLKCLYLTRIGRLDILFGL